MHNKGTDKNGGTEDMKGSIPHKCHKDDKCQLNRDEPRRLIIHQNVDPQAGDGHVTGGFGGRSKVLPHRHPAGQQVPRDTYEVSGQ